MILERLVLLSSLLVVPLVANAQVAAPVVTKDPQALSVLTQSLSTVGALPTINAIQDYTGTGTITYSWAGQEVQGAVTVHGKSLSDFRMDANLAQGIQTLAVRGGIARLRTTDGQLKRLPFYNFANAGSLTFPALRIADAIADQTVNLTLIGPTETDGHQVIQVRATFPVASALTTALQFSDFGTLDFFVDSTSFQLVKISETVRSERNIETTFLHEITFGNYQVLGNLAVPCAIAERVGGQQTWSIALQTISFNSGLTDAAFSIN
jgi:hypothetical protein